MRHTAAALALLVAVAGGVVVWRTSGDDEPPLPTTGSPIPVSVPPAPASGNPAGPEVPARAPDAPKEVPAPAEPLPAPAPVRHAPDAARPAPLRRFDVPAPPSSGAKEAARRRPPRRLPAPPLTWRDGDRERRSWPDPTLLAEWGGRERVRDLVPGAEAVTTGPRFRLWRLPPGTQASEVLDTLLAEEEPAEVFPVLRDGPTDEAPLRALSGRIVVAFAAETAEGAASAWAEERSYEVVRRLSFGVGLYLMAVGPTGLGAFELVETLRALPEVADAHLDWWQEKVPD